MIFYSPSKNGFFDSSIHNENQIPSDAIEITKEEHTALFNAQAQGKQIVSDENGKPVAIDRKPAVLSPERAGEIIRNERNRRLTATDYLMMPDYPMTEDLRLEWQIYRQELREIPTKEGFPWDGVISQVPWPTKPSN